jgi:(E)-4-hydroxy-3-methylbut-2-enyl-diphosphate synthase
MRLKTPTVRIGSIKIGFGYDIAIQSMTDTDTADHKKTAAQCIELAEAGSELVRITINNDFAALAVPKIRKIMDEKGYKHIPLIGDFHFQGHILLTDFPECAKVLDKYRINPGNVGKGINHDKNFEAIIRIAIKNKKPVRIGVNGGSIDEELLSEMMGKNAKLKNPKSVKEVFLMTAVESAWKSALYAEKLGLGRDKIVLGIKMSEMKDVIEANRLLAKKMKDKNIFYAIHMGMTEAGSGLKGIVASSSTAAILLSEGIGDTIRISITPELKDKRTKEVEVCRALLQSMGFRNFSPSITSCPGCGRTNPEFFRKIVEEVNKKLKEKEKDWLKKYPKTKDTKISIMGCVVNGIGEAQNADIAISLPGKTEKPIAPVYIKGKFIKSLSGKNIPEQFVKMVEEFLKG